MVRPVALLTVMLRQRRLYRPQARGSVTPTCPWYLPPRSL